MAFPSRINPEALAAAPSAFSLSFNACISVHVLTAHGCLRTAKQEAPSDSPVRQDWHWTCRNPAQWMAPTPHWLCRGTACGGIPTTSLMAPHTLEQMSKSDCCGQYQVLSDSVKPQQLYVTCCLPAADNAIKCLLCCFCRAAAVPSVVIFHEVKEWQQLIRDPSPVAWFTIYLCGANMYKCCSSKDWKMWESVAFQNVERKKKQGTEACRRQ